MYTLLGLKSSPGYTTLAGLSQGWGGVQCWEGIDDHTLLAPSTLAHGRNTFSGKTPDSWRAQTQSYLKAERASRASATQTPGVKGRWQPSSGAHAQRPLRGEGLRGGSGWPAGLGAEKGQDGRGRVDHSEDPHHRREWGGQVQVRRCVGSDESGGAFSASAASGSWAVTGTVNDAGPAVAGLGPSPLAPSPASRVTLRPLLPAPHPASARFTGSTRPKFYG